MSTKEKETAAQENMNEKEQLLQLSETWAQDARADLDDWIEEQGVYLRQ